MKQKLKAWVEEHWKQMLQVEHEGWEISLLVLPTTKLGDEKTRTKLPLWRQKQKRNW
jgi:hypothetical protein